MKIFLIATVLWFLSACGTVFSGTVEDIRFEANVANVDIYVDGLKVCTTPCVYPLERNSGSVSIMGKKAGYEDEMFSLRTKFNPVSAGNLISVYSWTTDFADGAVWKYQRNGVYLNMKKSGMTAAEVSAFKRESEIRRFVLLNYPELGAEAARGESSEYIQALAALSQIDVKKLSLGIRESDNEIDCVKRVMRNYP